MAKTKAENQAPVESKGSIETKGQFFIVLTEFKEIFGGWSESDPAADIIVLNNVRQVIYFSADTKGLLGLAANGPGKDSRISNECPQVIIRKPINVLLANQAAIDKFSTVIWK